MEVHVRLGPGFSTQTGAARLSVTLPAGATVDDLLRHLRATYPDNASGFDAALPVVRGSYVPKRHELVPGEEVSLLRPVSGG
jgi:molybdopterin converting factor small subunit